MITKGNTHASLTVNQQKCFVLLCFDGWNVMCFEQVFLHLIFKYNLDGEKKAWLVLPLTE